jgi:hypothetical protein
MFFSDYINMVIPEKIARRTLRVPHIPIQISSPYFKTFPLLRIKIKKTKKIKNLKREKNLNNKGL